MNIDTLCKELGIKQYDTLFKVNRTLPYKLSDDAKRFPYWELDICDYHKEVKTLLDEGKVILNHKLCPDSIAMTILEFKDVISNADRLSWDAYYKIQEQILDTLQNESDAVEASGKLAPGYMFNVGVADGCAIYKVTKVTPKSVTVEIRNHGDNYQDRFLGHGHKLSRSDFNRISRWGVPALFSRKSPF